jgi:ankyrin repeat protein
LFGGGKKRAAELHAAVQAGDIAGVRAALDKGADINAREPVYQETALHVAVGNENKALVQFLLSRGANPNIISGQNYTPLIIASAIGDRALPIVELLLAGRADPLLAPKSGPNADGDPLFVAATKGANSIIRHLLEFGVIPKVLPNGSTLMHMAGIGGDAETVAIAQKNGATVHDVDRDGSTPLHYAVIHTNDIAVAALLDRGSDIEKRNVHDATPLHHAALGNRPTTLKLLLERGANPDVTAIEGDSVMSPLLGAALRGYDEVVKLLLDAGVSPEQMVGHYPPTIEMATQAGKSSTVKLLQAAIRKRQKAAANDVRTSASAPDNSKVIASGLEAKAIRDMSLIEFGEAFYQNVRFHNAVAAAAAQGKLSFETIGNYLDAGEAGKLELLRLPNIGVNSVTGLDEAILAAIQRQPSASFSEAEPSAVATVREDLANQIESSYPGVFAPLLNEYAATPESDGISRSKLEMEMQHILSDARLADVATRRFRGETLAEIGESLGLTRERVRQIEARVKHWITVADSEPETAMSDSDNPVAVPDGIRERWFEMYQRLRDYYEQHGDADVPHQWPDDSKLGAWVGNQRQKYKKEELIPEQIRMLEELGFTWSLRERGSWDDRFEELVEFKQRYGHFDVPADYAVAPKLKQFIASTRHLYKEGSLESERVERLKGVGFTFDTGSRRLRKGADEPVITLNELPEGFTLKGRTIAITGRLEQYTRDEATRLARQHGATVLDKFSNKVQLLVVGTDAASKLDAALQRGIPVIDEAHFSALLAADGQSS